MKQKYFLVLTAILMVVVMNLRAQENLLQGGAMEAADESFWSISNLENAETSTTAYEFGYEGVSPLGGDGSALYLTATNSGADGSHLMVYQAVTLIGGQQYLFDLAAKATMPMLSSWLEVYVGIIEPADGADFGAVKDQVITLGGFKSSNWESKCDDNFDGTLQEIGCLAGSQGAFTAPGEGEQTYYIGFKVGIWGEATTIEFVVDNISLVAYEDENTGINSMVKNNFSIYPNPANSAIAVEYTKPFNALRILNQVGQEVIVFPYNSGQIDISSLNQGIFIVELLNNKVAVAHSRFIKQ
ncbi:MAG TPA: T9SS type A sorting domain-containing protein [Prolixibacteraceae bacterium]|nr:T9SS type A sorting domain-containing protein [Prolixibacteraceae bacterium]